MTEITVTQTERFFDKEDLIVSKTDLSGRITYANDVFIHVALYTEEELLGQQHSIVRHPDMPRCVFKLLWDELQAGREIFAYVKNRAKNGDFYWVNAHVTPSYDASGAIYSYHSTRRAPERRIIDEIITPLYRDLLAEEQRHANAKDGMQASFEMVVGLLEKHNMDYDQFIQTL